MDKKETKFIDPELNYKHEYNASQVIDKVLKYSLGTRANTDYLEGKIEAQAERIENLMFLSILMFKKIQKGEKFSDQEISDMSGYDIVF